MPDTVVATLTSMRAYLDGFADAFPVGAALVRFDDMAKAILATRLAPAPLDVGLDGDDTAQMAAVQRRGLFVLPFGRARGWAGVSSLWPDREARRGYPAA
ncbi:MAG TPA: hypothetical protein VLA78_08455 [Paracoccaceae bacterium]|nr:hypothetical protein [Paracoccaceae bacterium]